MLFFIILLFLIKGIIPANILAIAPYPSWSHQQPLLSVSKELVKRGHHLTVITTNPPEEKLENWTTIDISSTYKRVEEFHKEFGFMFQKEWNAYSFLTTLDKALSKVTDYILSLPQVQEFIRNTVPTGFADMVMGQSLDPSSDIINQDPNKKRYDLVLLEDLMFSGFCGVVHKIGAPPVVGIHTLSNWYLTDWSMMIPVNPSYMPDLFVGYTDKMDFFQRVYNTIYYWLAMYHMEIDIIPMQQKVLTKYFGSDAPSAREFERNKSLILFSGDSTTAYPQPLPPNFIQVGPLHIHWPKSLPEDLEQWFNGAEDGVCYFSMGSNMKSTSFRKETRDAFVKAFAKFPKIRFLWKYESNEKIPGLSSNVLTMNWIPQQDILGHKKLRLFITQGGLQSLQEAMNYAIPILGIPMFADQRHNTWKMMKEGAGISMEINEVNSETLYNAINKILFEEKDTFKGNASRLSKIAHDKLVPAMDTAIWWIEYIIRHNGARHLRMASFDLSWYQLALIDVHAFLLILLLSICYLLYFLFNKIFKTFSEIIVTGYKKVEADSKRKISAYGQNTTNNRTIIKKTN